MNFIQIEVKTQVLNPRDTRYDEDSNQQVLIEDSQAPGTHYVEDSKQQVLILMKTCQSAGTHCDEDSQAPGTHYVEDSKQQILIVMKTCQSADTHCDEDLPISRYSL
jgi:hypothetical protein